MSKNKTEKFENINYELKFLVEKIDIGEIGLPDLQRDFVWKNAKIRDLFNSMYKGYPVGYLLFWKKASDNDGRHIGTDNKQKNADLVIVDGQQRLTSLYAVIKKIPVIRGNKKENIKIAFNPLEEKFEVANAVTGRDKSFINDISIFWVDNAEITKIFLNYIERLKTVKKEPTESEKEKIKGSIEKLKRITEFPFTALELASDIEVSEISEIFVRINSKGMPLNQANFILTLMSVFWNKGRVDLEKFCRDACVSATRGKSPFNHFIKPSPDQLLRVGVGVAFRRADLRHVYSMLHGKDMKTGNFSESLQKYNFALLEEAQKKVLNLQYWHDFMRCIRQAGFCGSKMISSKNNLLYSYVFYLIGRKEFKVPSFELKKIIARWFFMSAVTGRYTNSLESSVESDLARLQDVRDANGFVKALSQVCKIALTDSFWNISLPNEDLVTSASNSPSLFAYHAAQVLLTTPALFSKLNVANFLDPALQPNRSLERHHLFPKGFLREQNIIRIRNTNQIANYAGVEWDVNGEISDQPPAEYFPKMKVRFGKKNLKKMFQLHALPQDWEHMPYEVFLKERRVLMAQLIRKGYSTLE